MSKQTTDRRVERESLRLRKMREQWEELGWEFADMTVEVHLAIISLYQMICADMSYARRYTDASTSHCDGMVREAVMRKVISLISPGSVVRNEVVVYLLDLADRSDDPRSRLVWDDNPGLVTISRYG